MSILNQRAFSTTKTQNTISLQTQLAAVWIAVIILASSLAGTARAQTFITQPTTTTLWAGSQDITQFGTTGFSAPGSGLILEGTAISQYRNGTKNPDGLFPCQEPGAATACLPVRHLWYGDSFSGLCRVDPEVDDPIVTPVNGIGSFSVDVLSCLSPLSKASFVPGQLTFDTSTNTLYTVDISKTAAGILRIFYIPSGDNGQGSIDLIHVDSLVGTESTRNAFGGCPQLRDPHNGNPVPTQPSAAALGPDGNLYTGSFRDGAIIRIISPATFNTQTDCDNSGDTGQSPTAKIQIPILSTDEQFGSGHTFGLGWVGHTLFGGDNIAPWLLLNADTCLTAGNGNNTCANPLVGGAPLPTEFLATQVGAPQAGAASDAVYPNNAGTAMYFATIPNLTRITNVTSASSMTVNLNYGGTFSGITGITPDPRDPANSTVYVGADPSFGGINGSGQIWKVTPVLTVPPPAAPVITSAVAGPGTGQATLDWVPTLNGAPVLSYGIEILLASLTGGAPTPSGLPDVIITAPATTATISGLTVGTTYVFAVQACNADGCSAFSSFSSLVTAFAVQPPSATNVVAVDAGTGTSANVAWTASTGGSTITSSTITPFLGGVTALSPTIIQGSVTGGTVSGLTCGNSYTFTVALTNSAGTGAASAPSVPITISCTVTADVSVLESAPGVVTPGSQVTYTITIHNSGPASAASMTFSETLPAPFVASTTTQGACSGTVGLTAFSCNLGSLAAAATATVTVTVQLPGTTTGLFTNTVTVNVTDAAGTNIDPNLANNTASATVTSQGCAAGATTTDVQVAGASNNGNPVHGTPVTITWQIKDNQGAVAANCSAFTASTTSPTGDTYTINSASTTQGSCTIVNNQLSCNLGNIAGGGTATVTVTATPSGAAPANSYAMTGSASFTGTDTNTANNTSTVLIGAQ